MSNGTDFEVPPKPANPLTPDDLAKLTKADVTYWAKAGKWSIDQACALLRGFVPIDSWEPQAEALAYLMQLQTATLKAEMQRQNAEPLPDTLAPSEWLELALACGKVDEAMMRAINTGAESPKPAGTSRPPQRLEKMRQEILDMGESWYLARVERNEKPTKPEVGQEVADRLTRRGITKSKGGKGEPYDGNTIYRWFFQKWIPPESD